MTLSFFFTFKTVRIKAACQHLSPLMSDLIIKREFSMLFLRYAHEIKIRAAPIEQGQKPAVRMGIVRFRTAGYYQP